ncbi:MAG TPA: sigma-70 family RNA polymerase sigma factor [Acidimicrobiia bacterium]|nr:sigma-70 family RNA polymerase sigma factor [Acidimicrobiia bacterium]
MNSDLERRHRFELVAAHVYEPLQHYLRRRAAPDDAADALSETLLTVWRRLDDVPNDLPLPWCYGVAKRCLANQRRAARRHLRLVERIRTEAAISPSHETDDPALEAALSELSESDQELLRLWAWEQLEPREIALVLETTPNAVSLRLSRAKAKLESRLSRQDSSVVGQKRDRHTEEHRP